MAHDTRIDKIMQVIAKQDNDELQPLFQKANEAGISSAVIISIWYGQVNLTRQPQHIIDFLAGALGIDDQTGEDVESNISAETTEVAGTAKNADRPTQTVYYRNKLDFMDDECAPASVRKRSRPYFEKLLSAEIAAKKDIAEMSKEEFTAVFAELGYYNRQYLKNALQVLSHYFRWSVQTNRPTHDFWIGGGEVGEDDIDLSVAMKKMCVRSPRMLREVIEEKCPLDEMYAVPPLAVLAWMGFSQDEAIQIRNTDVSLVRRTICGKAIPVELYNIIRDYYSDQDCTVESVNGFGVRTLYVRNYGLFLKNRAHVSSARSTFTKSTITTLMNIEGLSYKDIQMSAKYYSIRQLEEIRRPTQEDICKIFGIEITNNAWRMKAMVIDRLIEYQAFLKAFYWL